MKINLSSHVIIPWPIKTVPADKENSRGKSTEIILSFGLLAMIWTTCPQLSKQIHELCD